ncbi:blood vessel epicardial substance [Plakobranchus ocellatus]|uniref:Blood vessel epicardial substance n=1 Tax=Plakobranchus ocellatus TaxID=259542 RepID=A0AAV4A5Y4_9GAST|nr:blood vessel epicardial substance [Plakobranchus ocellatus]
MGDIVFSLEPFANWSKLTLNTSHVIHTNNAITSHNFGRGSMLASSSSSSSSASSSSSSSSSSASESNEWGVTCRDWQEAQHALFQLANLCAAISLLTPGSFRHHLLFLRCLLLVAFFLFALWAGLFVCMVDVLIWNGIFLLVDLVHIVGLAYHNFPSKFSASVAEFYKRRLKPLKVCRRDYSDLCAAGEVLPLRLGSQYAMEGYTDSGHKLSVLLRGRLKVTVGGIFLHYVEANEFIDSTEFDAVPLDKDINEFITGKYQVSITACENSIILTWHRTALLKHLDYNPFLAAVLVNLIGKDVSDKLYRVQEQLARESTAASKVHSSQSSSLSEGRNCGMTSEVNFGVPHAHDVPAVQLPACSQARLTRNSNSIRSSSNSSTCSRCSRLGLELTVETTL